MRNYRSAYYVCLCVYVCVFFKLRLQTDVISAPPGTHVKSILPPPERVASSFTSYSMYKWPCDGFVVRSSYTMHARVHKLLCIVVYFVPLEVFS